jgi:hypothetical protein
MGPHISDTLVGHNINISLLQVDTAITKKAHKTKKVYPTGQWSVSSAAAVSAREVVATVAVSLLQGASVTTAGGMAASIAAITHR